MAEQVRTYANYAEWLRADLKAHDDPLFAVRVLKTVVSAVSRIDEPNQFEAAHAEPRSTNDADWDRVIRAAAEMTYSDRYPGSRPPWCIELDEPPAEWFYPTSRPSRFAFNLDRTPNAFFRRRICLGEGNLRTARERDRTWI